MEARKCSFCKSQVELGTGMMLVKKDGTVFYFCSSKCERNMALGRSPRKVNWTRKSKKDKAEKEKKPAKKRKKKKKKETK